MNVTANKKLFFTSKSSFQLYNSSFKSLKKLRRFLQNPGYQNRVGQFSETMKQQSQQQIFQIKETLKFMGPLTCHGNILTELEKDVKSFAGGNLRYFNKNWYEYTKDKYILNIIINGLKLNLKELSTQNIRPTYPLSSKENEIISIEITKLLKKLVID